MFYRRKIFLTLLERLKRPIAIIDLQKLLFLFSLDESTTTIYDFIPHKYGCYSFTVHGDQKVLESQGFISVIENAEDNIFSHIVLHPQTYADAHISLKKEDAAFLDSFVCSYGDKTTDELVEISYKRSPLHTLNSRWLKKFDSDVQFLSQVGSIRKEIKHANSALYTIGYEGLTIEAFILKLILKRVELVIDVRKNPVSMKRDFSKSRLKRYLEEVHIGYQHLPDLGIPRDIRDMYLPEGRKDELFQWYEQTVLPTNTESVNEVRYHTHQKNVALLCYERLPQDCHRSYLASYCMQKADKLPIIHLS